MFLCLPIEEYKRPTIQQKVSRPEELRRHEYQGSNHIMRGRWTEACQGEYEVCARITEKSPALPPLPFPSFTSSWKSDKGLLWESWGWSSLIFPGGDREVSWRMRRVQ